jgi:hypothetical protein
VWDDWELFWKVHNRKHTTDVTPSEMEQSIKRWLMMIPLITVVVMLTEEVLIRGAANGSPQPHERQWYTPKVEVVITTGHTGKPTVSIVPDPKPIITAPGRPAPRAWILSLLARW